MAMIEFLFSLSGVRLTQGEAEIAHKVSLIYIGAISFLFLIYRVLFSGSEHDIPPQDVSPEIPSPESCSLLIRSRRSVMPKDLSGEKVSREELETLLEAANWAPTHHRSEPWRFVVIEGSLAISDYLDMVETWYSDNKEDIPDSESSRLVSKVSSLKSLWPETVSHLVVICMLRQALDFRQTEWEEICSVGCSVQNLHLAATSVPGLAGFWSSHNWCR